MNNLLRVFLACLCLGWGGVGTASTADAPYPLASHSGRIEQLDFARNSMVVGGIRYEVAVDVEVEIGGSYGAFTMLTKGMPIRFDYLVVSDSERVMVQIQELPDGANLEET